MKSTIICDTLRFPILKSLLVSVYINSTLNYQIVCVNIKIQRGATDRRSALYNLDKNDYLNLFRGLKAVVFVMFSYMLPHRNSSREDCYSRRYCTNHFYSYHMQCPPFATFHYWFMFRRVTKPSTEG